MLEKLKSNLAEQLRHVAESDLVDVVLELLPPSQSPPSQPPPADPSAAPAAPPPPPSRAAKIAALRAAFDRTVAGVEDVVRRVGGEVTGQAWINQTVRARVPAGQVPELCRSDQVAAVGAPAPLKPDAG